MLPRHSAAIRSKPEPSARLEMVPPGSGQPPDELPLAPLAGAAAVWPRALLFRQPAPVPWEAVERRPMAPRSRCATGPRTAARSVPAEDEPESGAPQTLPESGWEQRAAGPRAAEAPRGRPVPPAGPLARVASAQEESWAKRQAPRSALVRQAAPRGPPEATRVRQARLERAARQARAARRELQELPARARRDRAEAERRHPVRAAPGQDPKARPPPVFRGTVRSASDRRIDN